MMPDEIENFLLLTYRHARRIVVLVVGVSVLLFGVALLVLPGPAFVVIPLGLGILAVEFTWARIWMRRIKKLIVKARQQLTSDEKAKDDLNQDKVI